MSKKDVDRYYESICDDYLEMLESIKEVENNANATMVDPDVLSNLETIIKPLKDNYMRISYIMYLLNKPNKKNKVKKYQKLYKSQLDNSIGLENIKNEDRQVIQQIRSI